MMDAEKMRWLLAYDPETGALTWKARSSEMFKTQRTCNAWNTNYAGKPALNARRAGGYKHGAVWGMSVLAHRAAWAVTHGEWPLFIDHINGDRADNRLINLRSVTIGENNRNQRLRADNKPGVIGVHFLKDKGLWLANIPVNGRRKTLGRYKTLEAAADARKAAEVAQGYHPLHGTRREHFHDGQEPAGFQQAQPVAA